MLVERYGIDFTDIVKRPTAGSAELRTGSFGKARRGSRRSSAGSSTVSCGSRAPWDGAHSPGTPGGESPERWSGGIPSASALFTAHPQMVEPELLALCETRLRARNRLHHRCHPPWNPGWCTVARRTTLRNNALHKALTKAQDEVRELRAYPGRQAAARLWPDMSYAADPGPFEREGMISSESRMREIRTSGLMSGGEETWLRLRLRRRYRAKAAGNSYSLVPTAGRASPRLYSFLWKYRIPSTEHICCSTCARLRCEFI